MSETASLSTWERAVLHPLDDGEYRTAFSLGGILWPHTNRRIALTTGRATLQALERRGLVEAAPKRGRGRSWRRTDAGRIACHVAAGMDASEAGSGPTLAWRP